MKHLLTGLLVAVAAACSKAPPAQEPAAAPPSPAPAVAARAAVPPEEDPWDARYERADESDEDDYVPPDPSYSPPPPIAVAARAPHEAPALTGSPECDEYLMVFDRIVHHCTAELGPALSAMQQSRDAQNDAFKQWQTLDPASRQATIEAATTGCQSATQAVLVSAESMGCARANTPLPPPPAKPARKPKRKP